MLTEITRAAIERQLAAHCARFLPKVDSRLMRSIAIVLRALGTRNFLERYWTTIGRTIYYPACVDDPLAHPEVIAHELVHIRQWERWGLLFWLSYLLLPLPFFLAWYRFRWEREAYLVQLELALYRDEEIERIVDSLWFGYGRPWPRRWMRRWFAQKAREFDAARNA